MVAKCKNCGRKVAGSDLLCCHCGYPLAVSRVIPWPRRLWPVAPRQFWSLTMNLSLVVAFVAAIGMLVHAHRGLSCLYCVYPLLMALTDFVWAFLGSRKRLR